jgi:acetyl esterase/lipase
MTYAFDPELAVIVPHLPSTSLEDIQGARAWMESFGENAPPADESGLEISDHLAPGYEGAPDVLVRVYRPTGAAGPLPAILDIHGGGFVLGNIDRSHAGCCAMARNVGAVVATVEYRLAPEHPFPAAIHDCFAALVWFAAKADDLGVDRERIAVFGQSAGGGLAAGLALFTRDHDGPQICFQYLGIPELDDRLDTPSMRAFHDTPMWHRPNAEWSWRYYLGDPKPAEVSPYAAPARATDLAGLPPAYIATMEFDPLRDEGIHYALALMEAGVKVELHSFPGTFHGSILVANASVTKRINAELIVVLQRALGLDGVG